MILYHVDNHVDLSLYERESINLLLCSSVSAVPLTADEPILQLLLTTANVQTSTVMLYLQLGQKHGCYGWT